MCRAKIVRVSAEIARASRVGGIGAPALADSGQRRVIGQPVVQTEAGEPADGEVHLRLAHQATVMNDPQKEAGEHETHRRLGLDGRATDPGRVHLRHLVM